LAQELFAPYGIRPTYLVDYLVAADAEGSLVLHRAFESGHCELGAQMHPWTNPPFEEALGERNSYPCNLPQNLQCAKLEALLGTIRRNFGIEPRVYKAGRYGFGDSSAVLLEEFGFDVDTSVVPFTSFEHYHGPDFHGVPARPFWFGHNRAVLELPVTQNFAGLLGEHLGDRLYPWLDSSIGRRLRLPAIFARGRLLDRLMLSPEGMSLDELKLLARTLVRRGERLFTFSFHSPSLAPGNTPYVRTQADLQDLLTRIRRFLEYFFGELGGQSMTCRQLHGFFRERRTGN